VTVPVFRANIFFISQTIYLAILQYSQNIVVNKDYRSAVTIIITPVTNNNIKYVKYTTLLGA